MKTPIQAARATPGTVYHTRKGAEVEIVGRTSEGKIRLKNASGAHLDVPATHELYVPEPPVEVVDLVGRPQAELEPVLSDLTLRELEQLAEEDGRTFVLEALDNRTAEEKAKADAEQLAETAVCHVCHAPAGLGPIRRGSGSVLVFRGHYEGDAYCKGSGQEPQSVDDDCDDEIPEKATEAPEAPEVPETTDPPSDDGDGDGSSDDDCDDVEPELRAAATEILEGGTKVDIDEPADLWAEVGKTTDERIEHVKSISSLEELARHSYDGLQTRVQREIERHEAALQKVTTWAGLGVKALADGIRGKRIQERPGAVAAIRREYARLVDEGATPHPSEIKLGLFEDTPPGPLGGPFVTHDPHGGHDTSVYVESHELPRRSGYLESLAQLQGYEYPGPHILKGDAPFDFATSRWINWPTQAHHDGIYTTTVIVEVIEFTGQPWADEEKAPRNVGKTHRGLRFSHKGDLWVCTGRRALLHRGYLPPFDRHGKPVTPDVAQHAAGVVEVGPWDYSNWMADRVAADADSLSILRAILATNPAYLEGVRIMDDREDYPDNPYGEGADEFETAEAWLTALAFSWGVESASLDWLDLNEPVDTTPENPADPDMAAQLDDLREEIDRRDAANAEKLADLSKRLQRMKDDAALVEARNTELEEEVGTLREQARDAMVTRTNQKSELKAEVARLRAELKTAKKMASIGRAVCLEIGTPGEEAAVLEHATVEEVLDYLHEIQNNQGDATARFIGLCEVLGVSHQEDFGVIRESACRAKSAWDLLGERCTVVMLPDGKADIWTADDEGRRKQIQIGVPVEGSQNPAAPSLEARAAALKPQDGLLTVREDETDVEAFGHAMRHVGEAAGLAEDLGLYFDLRITNRPETAGSE